MIVRFLQDTIHEIVTLLIQPLNIAFVALLVIYHYLTGAASIWLWYVIAGIWYISWSVKRGPLDLACHWARSKLWSNLQQLRWQAMLSVLILAVGILYLVVVRNERVIIAGRYINMPYERWEIAALLWNAVFTTLSRLAVKPHAHPWRHFLFSVGRIGITARLTKAALESLARREHLLHLRYVTALAGVYLIVDVFEMMSNWKDKEERKLYFETVLADVPTAIGLFIFAMMTRTSAQWTSYFVSGALAVQFLLSFVVIAIVEGRISEVFQLGPPAKVQSATA